MPHLISSASPAIVCHMEKRTEEWLRQSDYDMDTAEYMYRGQILLCCLHVPPCHREIMDKAAVVNIVHRFRQGLEARGIKVERVILYGSYAGTANKAGSDIDLVVISSDFATRSYWERVDVLADAIYEVFAPVEAVAMTPEEWERGESFVVDFARNGEVLYAA
jgi:predicted nucleotidyltransferase